MREDEGAHLERMADLRNERVRAYIDRACRSEYGQKAKKGKHDTTKSVLSL